MQTGKKIAFFGTPPFTTRFLEALEAAGYAPTLIITNPDRPSGRGMKLTPPEPKVWGESRGIRVLQPESLAEETITELSTQAWDLFIVIAYGKIMPETLITLPTHGTINVHYSLLPKYRGATPVESAILHGDRETGVCIQQMRYKVDTGPIFAQQTVPLEPTDTTVSLREKLNDEALQLLPGVISSIFDGTAQPIEQNDTGVSLTKKIAKEAGEIVLTDDAVTLDRTFRAYGQSPGVFFITEKNGLKIRVKVKVGHLADGHFMLDTIVPENGKPLTGSDVQQWLA